MPTIHREGGYAFEIYTHDHGKPHIHVWKAGRSAKIGLGGPDSDPVVVRSNMRAKDLRRALTIATAERMRFIQIWRSIHG